MSNAHPALARRTLAAMAIGMLLFSASACSSDSSDGKASDSGTTAAPGDTTADGGSDGGSDEQAAGDPCQWYTVDEMKALLGMENVTMEAQTVGETSKCVYDAPDNYSSVEITPQTPEQYASTKSFAESPDGVGIGGEVIAVDGVGDEGWGHKSKGGADIGVLAGDKAVGVAITNGGGGETAGNIDTEDKALDLAKQIATKVLA